MSNHNTSTADIAPGIYNLNIIQLAYASLLFSLCLYQVALTWEGWPRKQHPHTNDKAPHLCFFKKFVHRVCFLTLSFEILRGVDLYGIRGIYSVHFHIVIHILPKASSFWVLVEYAIATLKIRRRSVLGASALTKKSRMTFFLLRVLPFSWYSTELLIHLCAPVKVGNIMDIVAYACSLLGYVLIGALIWIEFKTFENTLLSASAHSDSSGKENGKDATARRLCKTRWMWVGALLCGAVWTLVGTLNRVDRLDYSQFGEQDLSTVNASNVFSALNMLIFCTLFIFLAWAKPIKQSKQVYTENHHKKRVSTRLQLSIDESSAWKDSQTDVHSPKSKHST